MGDYCLRKIFNKILKQFKTLFKERLYLSTCPIIGRTLEDRGFNQVKGLLERNPYKDIFAEKRH